MSDDLEKDEGRGFKVQDRRRFTDEGDAREEEVRDASDSSAATGPTDAARGDQETSESEPRSPGRDAEGEELPPINFSTFIISLSTQALMLLGEIDDPQTGVAQKDVAVAKQTIDIIGMLDEKCRGNLDEHEERLMKEVLYNLRMRYVEAVRHK